MAKENGDANLFDIPLDTMDIKVSDEISLKVPKQTKQDKKETEDQPDTGNLIKQAMQGMETPPLLAVDLNQEEKESIVEKSTKKKIPKAEKTEDTQTTEEDKSKVSEEEKEQKTEDQGKGEGSQEEKISPMYLHAAALHESGILPNLDLESLKDLEGEAFINKLIDASRDEVNTQVKSQVDAYKNQFNDDQKRVIEMIEKGVSFDDASNVVYNQLRYESLTEAQIKEDPQLQERLYREFLYVKGHNDKFIERAVKQSKDLENLENDALESQVELTRIAKEEEEGLVAEAEQEKKTREQKNKEMLTKIKENVSSTKEIFEGMELTKTDQDKILEYMTVPVSYINQNGQKIPISKRDEIRMKNPIEYEKRIAYLIHLGYFDEKPKLTKLEKKSETSAVKKLSDILLGKQAPAPGKPIAESGSKDKTPKFILPGGAKIDLKE